MDVFEINNVDITPYIAERGVKWRRVDVEGPNSGTTLSGATIRDRIASKIVIEVTFIAAETDTLTPILNLFDDDYFTVRYDDPLYGLRTITATTYETQAALFVRYSDGTTFWEGVTVTIKER